SPSAVCGVRRGGLQAEAGRSRCEHQRDGHRRAPGAGLAVIDLPRVQEVAVGGDVVFGRAPLVLIAGPCVIESEAHALDLARQIAGMARAAGVPYIFKASFDKANRTSVTSFRGPGLEAGVAVLGRVRDELGVPILTDIHEPWQAEPVAAVADVLQIPAFLSRQTDLVTAAARTGR